MSDEVLVNEYCAKHGTVRPGDRCMEGCAMRGWGWGGCEEYCEHGGICMEALPHATHHTGTHPFTMVLSCSCAEHGGCPRACAACVVCTGGQEPRT
jgi:hypothetical protein